MKKLLIITPHLSTGGAPQVTLNKIELLHKDYYIKCIEYSLIAWNYVVQRNKIINILGNDFHSLGENKSELLDIINEFQPDIISMEEFPEFFMSDNITKDIYKNERNYKIFETTHDSSFPVKDKRWFPDKFHFVSAYNAFKFSMFDIPYSVIEYPVDKKQKKQKENQEFLGFSPDWKHVVNVGLFTSRKNQKYLFEIAEYLKEHKIKFHFIGNQAGNFKSYWEPLLQNKPENCVLWGERDDVYRFLEASDLFFFASKGGKNDKELNPIAIKEALEYEMPIMLFNLDVYCGKYDNDPNLTFLTGDLVEDSKKLLNILNPDKEDILFEPEKDDEVIVISTYPNTTTRKKLTRDCILSFKKTGRKIILSSHYPVPTDIQELVDYCIYDKHNPLIKNTYYTYFFNNTSKYEMKLNVNVLENPNQSLAAMTNLLNGAKLSKELGISKILFVVFDVILNEKDMDRVNGIFSKMDEWNTYLCRLETGAGVGYETTAMGFRTDYFLKKFKDIRDEEQFTNYCRSIGCHNFLEDYFMNILKNEPNLWIESGVTILPESGIGLSSNSEYISVLPIDGKENEFVFYFFTYNIDDRYITIKIEENEDVIFNETHSILKTNEIVKEIKFNGNPIKITVDWVDDGINYKTKVFDLNSENISLYKTTGIFKYRKQKKDYKFKIVHLQTNIQDDREIKSFKSLSPIKKLGVEYVRYKNKPYKNLPPSDTCARPISVSMELFDEETTKTRGTALTPAHYGCYKSFKDGILNEFTDDVDFLIVCEGDCILEVSPQEFMETAKKCGEIILNNDIGYFSFGDTHLLDMGWRQSEVVAEIPNQDLMFITNKIIGIQSIMFPKTHREFLFDKLNNSKWDAADIYFNNIFREGNVKMGILKNRITTQSNGFSLIDKQEKTFMKKVKL
jgi:hypothetical protein